MAHQAPKNGVKQHQTVPKRNSSNRTEGKLNLQPQFKNDTPTFLRWGLHDKMSVKSDGTSRSKQSQ